MKYKSGNTFILLFIFLLSSFILVCVFLVSILYLQIDISLQSIKLDLHSIVKNVALKNCDKELLKNNVYYFDLQEMKENINEILYKNYNNVMVESITYNQDSNNFEVKLKSNIKPIIGIKNSRTFTISIQEKVKFKTMEVTNISN